MPPPSNRGAGAYGMGYYNNTSHMMGAPANNIQQNQQMLYGNAAVTNQGYYYP